MPGKKRKRDQLGHQGYINMPDDDNDDDDDDDYNAHRKVRV